MGGVLGEEFKVFGGAGKGEVRGRADGVWKVTGGTERGWLRVREAVMGGDWEAAVCGLGVFWLISTGFCRRVYNILPASCTANK